MNAYEVKIGQTVYLKNTNKSGTVLKREKYHFNLKTKFTIKWDDNSQTEESAANLRVNSKTTNDKLKLKYQQRQMINNIINKLLIAAKASPDLIKAPYKHQKDNPLSGHCYIVCEALKSIYGDLKPYVVKHHGTHWFLKDKNTIIDPTAEQFQDKIPYHEAKGCGFLTKLPSKRAQELMRRAGIKKVLINNFVEYTTYIQKLIKDFNCLEDFENHFDITPYDEDENPEEYENGEIQIETVQHKPDTYPCIYVHIDQDEFYDEFVYLREFV